MIFTKIPLEVGGRRSWLHGPQTVPPTVTLAVLSDSIALVGHVLEVLLELLFGPLNSMYRLEREVLDSTT